MARVFNLYLNCTHCEDSSEADATRRDADALITILLSDCHSVYSQESAPPYLEGQFVQDIERVMRRLSGGPPADQNQLGLGD